MLPMPTLGVGAEWGYGGASAQTVRRVASDVQEALIERSGHYIPEERPDELARVMLDFLTKLPSPGSLTSKAAKQN